MKSWIVYIARAKNEKLYTGITNNLEKRIEEHSSGKGGARFFRSSPFEKVVFQEKHADKSSALKRECAIKKLTRIKKLVLIEGASR